MVEDVDRAVLGPYRKDKTTLPPGQSGFGERKGGGPEIVDNVITARTKDLLDRTAINGMGSPELIRMALNKHRFLVGAAGKLVDDAKFTVKDLQCQMAETLLDIHGELNERLASYDYSVYCEAWEATNNPLGLLEYTPPFSDENVALWRSLCPKPVVRRKPRRRSHERAGPNLTTPTYQPGKALPREKPGGMKTMTKKEQLKTAASIGRSLSINGAIRKWFVRNVKAYAAAMAQTGNAAYKRGLAWSVGDFEAAIVKGGAGSDEAKYRVSWKKPFEAIKASRTFKNQQGWGVGRRHVPAHLERGCKRGASLTNLAIRKAEDWMWENFKHPSGHLRGANELVNDPHFLAAMHEARKVAVTALRREIFANVKEKIEHTYGG